MLKLNRKLIFGLCFTGLGLLLVPAQQLQPATPPSRPAGVVPPPPWTNIFGARGATRFQVAAPQPGQVEQTATNIATAAIASPDTNGIGPKITFQTPVYDFGRVKSGDPIDYTYIFTNTGDRVLEISNVQMQCGCTQAGEWTKKVEPGETGKVPIRFTTANYSHQVIKTVTVASNDRTQPVVVLQLKGTLWKPIELIPPYTILNITPDAVTASSVVKIVNNMEEPLTLSTPECNNPAFSVELKTNTPGKEFQLTLTPVPPFKPGSIQGKVTLKSSATNAPTIEVPFWANVQAPLMVLPAQLMIPATLSTPVSPTVTIQNNTTNSIALSDAVVSIPGAEAQIKELQPGRIFTVQVSLPQGLQLPQGQKGLLTVKTSHPHYKVVEVPIVQMPKPTTMFQPPVQAPFGAKPLTKAQIPAALQPAGAAAGGSLTNKTQLQ